MIDEPPTDEEALEMLRTGRLAEWNRLREVFLQWNPDLSYLELRANLREANLRGARLEGAGLAGAHLEGADLRGARLEGADLLDAHLEGADLGNASLEGASLVSAHLEGADLFGAHLEGADLLGAHLEGADLRRTHLEGAYLGHVHLEGADLCRADLTNAAVHDVVYVRRRLRGKCEGLKGVESVYGDAIFRRDVLDQDYLDTLEERWKGSWKHWLLFEPWGWIDYGRSLRNTALFGLLIAVLFGIFFLGLDLLGCRVLHYADHTPDNLFTPFYYSIVTFTTLGFGDVTPANLGGQILVTIEVVLGYLSLGLLISVLANKVARRS